MEVDSFGLDATVFVLQVCLLGMEVGSLVVEDIDICALEVDFPGMKAIVLV